MFVQPYRSGLPHPIFIFLFLCDPVEMVRTHPKPFEVMFLNVLETYFPTKRPLEVRLNEIEVPDAERLNTNNS